jgi:hypothetical protein
MRISSCSDYQRNPNVTGMTRVGKFASGRILIPGFGEEAGSVVQHIGTSDSGAQVKVALAVTRGKRSEKRM